MIDRFISTQKKVEATCWNCLKYFVSTPPSRTRATRPVLATWHHKTKHQSIVKADYIENAGRGIIQHLLNICLKSKNPSW